MDPFEPEGGVGVLARITFEVTEAGNSYLWLSGVVIRDSHGDVYPVVSSTAPYPYNAYIEGKRLTQDPIACHQ